MELTKRHLQEIQDAMDNKAIDISADGQIYRTERGTDDDGCDTVRFHEIIHLESLIEALEAA